MILFLYHPHQYLILATSSIGEELMSCRIAGLVLGLLIVAAGTASAGQDNDGGYFRNWFVRSDKSKEEQPHWMTPIVTVTPRLEQEIREDFLWQPRPNGDYLTNYGGQKGLELIPTDDTEIIIGIPTYQMLRSSKKPFKEVGWADENLLLKYRFLTANEEHGNYIVTGFLGVTLPTGSEEFTKKQVIYTPTIAAGKGWGTRRAGFDIQSTLSASIPDGHEKAIGVPIVWNTALQPYGFKYFWPEVEFGYTYWMDGPTKKKDPVDHHRGIDPGAISGLGPRQGGRRPRLPDASHDLPDSGAYVDIDDPLPVLKMKQRAKWVLGVIVLAVFEGMLSGHLHAGEVSIAAASDLNFVFKEMVPDFEGKTGHTVKLSLGSSGNFYAQISNGAPFDLY